MGWLTLALRRILREHNFLYFTSFLNNVINMTVSLQVIVYNNSKDLIGIGTLDDIAANYYRVNETIRVA